MNIVAFDLSLTRPAACVNGRVDVCDTKKMRGHQRLEHILGWSHAHVNGTRRRGRTLVAIEGYAYGRTNQSHQIGELGGLIRHQLWADAQPYIEVAPSVIKKYATGKGNAGKEDVLAAAIRRGRDLFTGTSNDEADAWWLWALTTDLVGDPHVEMPLTHRSVLEKLDNPYKDAA